MDAIGEGAAGYPASSPDAASAATGLTDNAVADASATEGDDTSVTSQDRNDSFTSSDSASAES